MEPTNSFEQIQNLIGELLEADRVVAAWAVQVAAADLADDATALNYFLRQVNNDPRVSTANLLLEVTRRINLLAEGGDPAVIEAAELIARANRRLAFLLTSNRIKSAIPSQSKDGTHGHFSGE